MKLLAQIAQCVSKKARKKRAALFQNAFIINQDTKILDLGSENGANINSVLQGLKIKPANVFIADINAAMVDEGSRLFGFTPVVIQESGSLLYPDNYFDIVYCSSVIEHVTIPKKDVWSLNSGRKFKEYSFDRQKKFANEIRRLGRQYFVQTPYKYFPVESHTWLPFLSWLPRRLLIPILRFTNKVWVKKTSPDWNLLTNVEMVSLFSEAQIVEEKMLGFTKSLMAIYSKGTALPK